MRVFLRELTKEDVTENYLTGFQNENVTAFLEVDGKSLSVEDVIDYMEAGRNSGKYFMYAVCTNEGKHIGNLKVGPINHKNMTSDLVTVIWDEDYWGKGLATESIKLGNKLAFEKYNIRKLTGGMYSSNIGSVKAYTKAGWIIEATLQNHYMVNGKLEDRIIVSCFNPPFFPNEK